GGFVEHHGRGGRYRDLGGDEPRLAGWSLFPPRLGARLRRLCRPQAGVARVCAHSDCDGMNGGSEYEEAYQIAKLQAATDGTFEEVQLRHWFAAAWELCSAAIGFNFPSREITEQVAVNPNG